MDLASHGTYLKNNLKRDFRKHCFIKKEQANPMLRGATRHLKGSFLVFGKNIAGKITGKGNYLQIG
jgi:hypothetical protein